MVARRIGTVNGLCRDNARISGGDAQDVPEYQASFHRLQCDKCAGKNGDEAGRNGDDEEAFLEMPHVLDKPVSSLKPFGFQLFLFLKTGPVVALQKIFHLIVLPVRRRTVESFV